MISTSLNVLGKDIYASNLFPKMEVNTVHESVRTGLLIREGR
jgi:hypothetical protein